MHGGNLKLISNTLVWFDLLLLLVTQLTSHTCVCFNHAGGSFVTQDGDQACGTGQDM
jgi:hypothetical protein